MTFSGGDGGDGDEWIKRITPLLLSSGKEGSPDDTMRQIIFYMSFAMKQ
jgi:hypothetical protein